MERQTRPGSEVCSNLRGAHVGHSLSHTVTDSFAAFTVGRYWDVRPKFACVARARPNAKFTLQIFIS